jgi:hypothetical protein
MNYFGLTLFGLRLTLTGYRQLAFTRKFLKPLVLKHCSRIGYVLTPAEKKKILFYYPMYTVLACAQMYLTLKGRKLTRDERRRLTLVGAMATICDDLIDELHYSRKKIFELLSGDYIENDLDKKARLLVALNKELYSVCGTIPEEFLPRLKMALQRQAASIYQADPAISPEDIIAICREKNGHTSLMFASLLDENWSLTELQFIYQSAIAGQLTNDSFDIYFDTRDGIRTYFNSAPSIKKVREFFMVECEKLHSLVMSCDASKKNKLQTIRRMSILHAFTLTALDQLQQTENKYSTPVDWKNIPRKEMITDMWKNRNRLKTVRYMKHLSELIPVDMKREPIDSDTIKSVGYNEDKHLLEIEMLSNGRIYQYHDVPLEEYFDFMDAKSLTEYYNRVIKVKYAFKELA